MKKLVAFFLAITFLVGTLPVYIVSSAATGNTCGGEGNEANVTWSFDSATGTLTISGTGTMENWFHEMDLSIAAQFGFDVGDYLPSDQEYVYTPWYSIREKILHAVVSDGITTLGDFTFSGCTNLKDVKLSKDLTVIGHGAFENCKALSKVTIPSGVTEIGVGAFYFNVSLTSVTVPEGVKTLNYGAFSFSSGLKTIDLPSTLTTMSACTFMGCQGLTSIEIPEQIRGISGYTFYDCRSLSEIKFLGDIRYFNQNAFYQCNGLNSITIPKTVTTIHSTAFAKCKRLLTFNVFPGSYGETYCKETYTNSRYTINVHEHTWKATEVVTPTCSEGGYTLESCEGCGETRKTNVVEPTGKHQFANYVILSHPDCVNDGQRVGYCTICGAEDVKVLLAYGHEYEEWTVVEPTSCKEDGYKTRTCEFCGYEEYVVLPAPAHTYVTTTIPATCTGEGSVTDTCKVCGHTEQEILPKLEHSYTAVVVPATCTKEGYTSHTCSCGDSYVTDPTELLPHAFGDWKETSLGEESRSCTSCGKTETRENITALDVDGNGSVTAEDAKLLLEILVGNADGNSLSGDLDRDGVLTVYDCVLLLQYLEQTA